ncbi:hypothetical protein A2U01_0006669 [Trifolium medium]|uniref:Uncharacterized protein n=1 Tax=Trifolium medium TaxID=97028 RepID=A0A392MGD1_9FABA|nr:hypothetical protein [Trifolium medium]
MSYANYKNLITTNSPTDDGENPPIGGLGGGCGNNTRVTGTNSSTDHGSDGATAGSPSVPAGGGVAGHCRGVGGGSGNYYSGGYGYGGDYGKVIMVVLAALVH